MARKPYEDVAAAVKAKTRAQGVVVIIFGGAKGSGAALDVTAEMAALMPKLLRDVADEIERDAKRGVM